MAIANFITPGSYTRIEQIIVLKNPSRVDFSVNVYDSQGGDLIYGPLGLGIDYLSALEEYKREQLILTDAPDYPSLCANREAMVPMWTEESTEEEKTAYLTAKEQYETDFLRWRAESDALIEAVKQEAETENKFSRFFSNQKIYTDSNATACAYEYLKTLPGFEEVEDV